jgi:CheY-specific phosphatase CheX
MPAEARPIAADVAEGFLGSFVTAVETALREVASTDVALRFTYQLRSHQYRGEIVAMLQLSSATAACLALGMTQETAKTLSRRMLSEIVPNPDDDLIRDCVGEIANVAAGQAKAILHGTQHALTFGTPRIYSAQEVPASGAQEMLVAVLASDVGEVVVQLFVA